MSVIFKVKRGPKARLASANIAQGEFVLCEDTGEVFLGQASEELLRIGVVNDMTESDISVWSSMKIKEAILELIDDNVISLLNTWSSTKIDTELNQIEVIIEDLTVDVIKNRVAVQSLISDPYNFTFVNQSIKWTVPFIANLAGKPHSLDGIFNIAMPAVGTSINTSSGTTVTVTSDGIPLNQRETLVYILPWSSTQATQNSNFLIINSTDTLTLSQDYVVLFSRKSGSNTVSYNSGMSKLPTIIDAHSVSTINLAGNSVRSKLVANVNMDSLKEYSNGTFTSKTTQRVLVIAGVHSVNLNNDRSIYIYLMKNGAVIFEVSVTAGNMKDAKGCLSYMVQVNQGDTLEVYASHSDGNNTRGVIFNSFQIRTIQ